MDDDNIMKGHGEKNQITHSKNKSLKNTINAYSMNAT